MEIADFCERVETIFGQHDLMAALLEKNLGATADGVAIVNDQYFHG